MKKERQTMNKKQLEADYLAYKELFDGKWDTEESRQAFILYHSKAYEEYLELKKIFEEGKLNENNQPFTQENLVVHLTMGFYWLQSIETPFTNEHEEEEALEWAVAKARLNDLNFDYILDESDEFYDTVEFYSDAYAKTLGVDSVSDLEDSWVYEMADFYYDLLTEYLDYMYLDLSYYGLDATYVGMANTQIDKTINDSTIRLDELVNP